MSERTRASYFRWVTKRRIGNSDIQLANLDPRGECLNVDWHQLVVGEARNRRCPVGYARIDSDLNKGARGKYVFFCVKQGAGRNFIADIEFAVGRKPKCKAGWTRNPVNLNEGAGGKHIRLCLSRVGMKRAVYGMRVVSSKKKAKATCSGKWKRIGTDLNKGAKGNYIFLCVVRR